MQYKIPDLNKIRLLAEYTIKKWDGWQFGISQTLLPIKDFGTELPIKDGDSVVYHCLNGGNVFLALAARLDADWTASDIRSSSIKHTRKKVEDPQFRLDNIVDSIRRRNSIADPEQQLKEAVYEEGHILQRRRIRYLQGDSNYLGVPVDSVDWTFSYEPVLFRELTALIEMLASARKGAVFAFSKKNNGDILKEPGKGDFSYFYDVAMAYGLKVDIIHGSADTLDEGEQELSFAIISSDSELPAIDRDVISYCANHVFPKQEIPGKEPAICEVDELPKGPFLVNLKHAEGTLNLAIKQPLERINKLMGLEYCDTKYSHVVDHKF